MRTGAYPRAAVVCGLVLLMGCHALPEKPPEPAPAPQLRFEPAQWNDLPGWALDDTRAAWPALLASCGTSRLGAAWGAFCGVARAVGAEDHVAQRALIETRLAPWHIVTVTGRERQEQGLITGYYEPVLNGSRTRGGPFQTPLHAVPDDLVTVELGDLYPALRGERVRGRLQGRRVTPYPDRAQLAGAGLPAGRQIVWVDSAADAFFLEIQGSGRVRLPDGSVIRLAFADVNGHPYRAIGRYLVERGEMTVEQATAPGIRQWLAAHPERQAEVFNSNPSVVFFREEPIGDPAAGPRGALGVPLTAGRSVAIDPRLLPLGAPMYLATTEPLSGTPLERLVLAQDTGGAIRGALRADLFWGLGGEAGEAAGRMRHDGSLWLLWPADQPLPGP